MKFKGLYTAMTAITLIAAPTLAAAAPIGTPLTQPASETVQGDNALDGTEIAVAILAVAAITAGIVAGTSNNSPTSP
jgi:hypothetical protein